MYDTKPIRRIFWISVSLGALCLFVAAVANLFDSSIGILEIFALPEVFLLTVVCFFMGLVILVEKARTICFRAARRLTRRST